MLNIFQQKCIDKAVYPNLGRNVIYPTLGLVGELGELYEKLALPHPGLMMDELQELIVLELGDVAWYVAMLCDEAGHQLGSVFDEIGYISDRLPAGSITQCASVISCIVDVTHFAEKLKKHIRKHGYQPGDDMYDDSMCEAVRVVSKKVMGMIFYISSSLGIGVQRVLDLNVDKIASRAKRGVLEGSGDKR